MGYFFFLDQPFFFASYSLFAEVFLPATPWLMSGSLPVLLPVMEQSPLHRPRVENVLNGLPHRVVLCCKFSFSIVVTSFITHLECRGILDTAAPFDSPPKSKRVRTMSEKARLIKEENQESKRPSKVARIKQGKFAERCVCQCYRLAAICLTAHYAVPKTLGWLSLTPHLL